MGLSGAHPTHPMKDIVKHFASLTAAQIRGTRSGQFDDYDLLEVYSYFSEQDDESATAVLDLILRSYDSNEMVAYGELYEERLDFAYQSQDWPALLHWTYAWLAFDEQHEQGANRNSLRLSLADAYCASGDLDAGLSIYSHCLQADPQSLEAIESAAFSLATAGLGELALETLAFAQQRSQPEDEEAHNERQQKIRAELMDTIAAFSGQPAAASPETIASFRRALAGAAGAEPFTGYFPPLDRLIVSAGQGDDLLRAEILAQGKVLAGDLIRLAFDPAYDQTPAAAAAIDLLRQLHQSRTVALDELQHFLDHAVGDWRSLLSDDFGKIGPYTSDEIEAVALDVANDLYFRSNAVAALAKRAQKLPTERPRVLAFLRTILTRPEASQSAAEETFVGNAISDALDLNASELYPEIEQAFREDRVDPEIISLQYVQKEWGLPLSPEQQEQQGGFLLALQCQKCERMRFHVVQRVFVDLETLEKQDKGEQVKYDPYVMDHEIICPKCGARDRYRTAPLSAMRLLLPEDNDALAAPIRSPNQGKFRLHPNVRAARGAAFSQIMHPLEALERYKMLILTHPKRADNHIRMGKVLRVLHRSDAALKAIRKGHELAPDNLDCTLERALAEHDLGDKNLARTFYEQVLRIASQTATQDESMLEATAWAARGQEALRRGQPSPWHQMTFGKPESAAPGAQSKG